MVSLLGLLTADGFDLLSLAAWKASTVAALPPVLIAVYGVLARLAGNLNSPLVVDTREASRPRSLPDITD